MRTYLRAILNVPFPAPCREKNVMRWEHPRMLGFYMEDPWRVAWASRRSARLKIILFWLTVGILMLFVATILPSLSGPKQFVRINFQDKSH